MSDASRRPSRALTLARQQWERGDWEGLLAWDQPELERHPDRGELLTLCAVAQLQLGNSQKGKALIDQALKSGFTFKKIGYLISSINKKSNTEDKHLKILAKHCLLQNDPLNEISKIEEKGGLNSEKLSRLYLALSDEFYQIKDFLNTENFANKSFFENSSKTLTEKIISILIKIGKPDRATELILENELEKLKKSKDLNLNEKERIQDSLDQLKKISQKNKQHGQILLIDYLSKHLKEKINASILIEIGTTREDVSGQGSTRQFADFCRKKNIKFITVDMDPRNSQIAQKMFEKLGMPHTAITSKGEDYLRKFEGMIDFVFLDAYDFDHGKHSEIRQKRYEKFLGSRIDEIQCHQMHLECAQILVEKLAPDGVICFDDTWQVDGKWVAKGTTAMPFLLNSGFEVIDERNRAALLRRKTR